MTKIIRMNQLVKRLGLSRSSIYRLRAQGDFVPAIRLGIRSVGYSEAAVSAWLEKREAETTQNK
ncbi:MAG: AlpA family phage regulatory protein [Gammaproteobacteria bacterium]|nr:MAG: AlpA family phage regulatory protein [Gammaproteobacteria bacterium]